MGNGSQVWDCTKPTKRTRYTSKSSLGTPVPWLSSPSFSFLISPYVPTYTPLDPLPPSTVEKCSVACMLMILYIYNKYLKFFVFHGMWERWWTYRCDCWSVYVDHTSNIGAHRVDGRMWAESWTVNAQIGTPLVNYISYDIYFHLERQQGTASHYKHPNCILALNASHLET